MADMHSLARSRPEEILLPAKPWFVMLTLLLGLVCNLTPMSSDALMLKPDFLALAILYWCIQEPRLIGVGIAWCVGLVMDVADATVFGQRHASLVNRPNGKIGRSVPYALKRGSICAPAAL